MLYFVAAFAVFVMFSLDDFEIMELPEFLSVEFDEWLLSLITALGWPLWILALIIQHTINALRK